MSPPANPRPSSLELKRSTSLLNATGKTLCPLVNADGGKVVLCVEMTIPDEPHSSRQRYRTTSAGRRLLEDE